MADYSTSELCDQLEAAIMTKHRVYPLSKNDLRKWARLVTFKSLLDAGLTLDEIDTALRPVLQKSGNPFTILRDAIDTEAGNWNDSSGPGWFIAAKQLITTIERKQLIAHIFD